MEVMMIRSGGFIGAIQGCRLNTDLLTEEEANKLEILVNSSGIRKDEQVFMYTIDDGYIYDISINDGYSTISASYDSGALNSDCLAEGIINLIGYLEECITTGKNTIGETDHENFIEFVSASTNPM